MAAPARFGKYDLLALLATGGMAEIWLARISGEAGFEKLVVIKRLLDQLALDAEFVEMFLDEARINARLQHSNIVQVMELGQVEGRYFMAMEYVPGLSVAQLGKRATKLLGDVPLEVAGGIVMQACVGLHYAHEKTLPDGKPLDIIHRDVSPQNLICTFEGLVKVLDFGIAKASERVSQTRTGMVKGKFSYMSPEQCLGAPLDRRSDVFTLGIVLFELATSRRLFKRASTYDTYLAITQADVPSPSAVNYKIAPALEAVIVKALQRRPEDRFASCDEMHEALDHALRTLGLHASPTDLGKFMEATFADEHEEQQRLVGQAQRGELDVSDVHARAVSPVAAAAALESQANYTVDDSRTSVDLLPALADESHRTMLAEESDLEQSWDSEHDIKTRAMVPQSHTAVTEPRGLPIVEDPPNQGPKPTIYYAFGTAGILLLVLIVWLIAR